MHINPITCNSSHRQNFKSNITFDIGGSQREGSCKIYYSTTDADEEIFKQQTTVNKLGKTKFKDGDDFIKCLVKKMGVIQKACRGVIREKEYPRSENTIKNIAFFLPSYTCGAHAYYLPNHRAADNRPLKDIDFDNLVDKLKAAKVNISPDVKIKIVQDAMGAGMAICKKLYDNDMLHPGSYYTVCITGGGCGISNIEMYDEDNVIIKSSGSGYLSQSLSMQKVSKAGASAPALIENFGRAFGLNEDEISDLKHCHKSEFTMLNPCTYEKDMKTEQLKECLLNTNKYVIESENDEFFMIKVKDEYLDDYNDARRNAIDKYCLALARLAIIKKTEGSNGMVITGPVAKSVNDAAKAYYGRSVGDWVTKHLKQSFNSYELEKMQKTYNFKVICDDEYSIANNTDCRRLIHQAEFINPNRGNWMRLKTEYLED